MGDYCQYQSSSRVTSLDNYTNTSWVGEITVNIHHQAGLLPLTIIHTNKTWVGEITVNINLPAGLLPLTVILTKHG